MFEEQKCVHYSIKDFYDNLKLYKSSYDDNNLKLFQTLGAFETVRLSIV